VLNVELGRAAMSEADFVQPVVRLKTKALEQFEIFDTGF